VTSKATSDGTIDDATKETNNERKKQVTKQTTLQDTKQVTKQTTVQDTKQVTKHMTFTRYETNDETNDLYKIPYTIRNKRPLQDTLPDTFYRILCTIRNK
jgi:hypothetical protein